MDTKELKSFIIAAKCGSFQKAAEQLFLSSTALIKQINGLEEELGFKLFIRTNRGILLTESGKYFYDASEDILRRCAEAIQNGRDRSPHKTEPIRIGFSPINPYHDVFSCYDIGEDFNKYLSNVVVPISGEFKNFIDEIRNLGSRVDVIPYFLGNNLLKPISEEFCLARIPMHIALPLNHSLADKDVLHYEDLNGQELVTLSDSVNIYYKEFNKVIMERAPHVRITPVSFIDFQTLNETVSGRRVLLVGEYLWNAHPLLKFIPLAEDLLLPYGLYYSPNPADSVLQLLQTFRENGVTGNVEDSRIVHFRHPEEPSPLY